MTQISSKQNVASKQLADGITVWPHHDQDSFSVMEVEFEPKAVEGLHYHEKSTQNIYVIKGTAQFTVDGQTHILSDGESILMLPGIPHGAENIGSETLNLKVVSQPSATNDRVVL